MVRIPAVKIRDELADIVNRVAYGGERVVIVRRGRDAAAIVSMDDVMRLEELENVHWSKEADKALADAERRGERPVPFERVERRLDAARGGARKRARAAK
jgi:prevent-host-death family protein